MMKHQLMARIVSCLTVLIMLAITPSLAQNAGDPLSAGQKMQHSRVKDFILRAAEKMPEADYSFKPTPEVRSFGQILGHIADTQYLFAAPILGEQTASRDVEKTKTTKADLVQALKDAFAYSDKAYDGLKDAQAAEMVKFFGQDRAKLTVLSGNTAHDNEHYGNLVTYLRMKGLVPPSSEPRK